MYPASVLAGDRTHILTQPNLAYVSHSIANRESVMLLSGRPQTNRLAKAVSDPEIRECLQNWITYSAGYNTTLAMIADNAINGPYSLAVHNGTYAAVEHLIELVHYRTLRLSAQLINLEAHSVVSKDRGPSLGRARAFGLHVASPDCTPLPLDARSASSVTLTPILT